MNVSSRTTDPRVRHHLTKAAVIALLALSSGLLAAAVRWSGWFLLPGLLLGFGAMFLGFVLQEEQDELRKRTERALPPGVPFPDSAPTDRPADATAPADRSLEPTAPPVAGVADTPVFSPDGRLLATSDGTRTVLLWDLTEPARPRHAATLPHVATPSAPAFSPDGRLLATVGDVGTTLLWKLDSIIGAPCPQPVGVLTNRSGKRGKAVTSLDFSADGRLLAIAGKDGSVLVWDLGASPVPARTAIVTYTRLTDKRTPNAIRVTRFGPEGRLLAVGGSPRGVGLWDLNDPTHPNRTAILRPHPTHWAATAAPTVHAVAFSPDGRLLATASDHDYTITPALGLASPPMHASTVVLWDITADRPIALCSLAERGGNRMTTATTKRRRPTPAVLTGHAATARALAFSPDGRLLATGGDDATVLLWDITDPARPGHRSTLPHTARVTALAFSPDGTTLATTDRALRLWTID